MAGLNTPDLKTQFEKTKLENESYKNKIGELESALRNEKEERTKEGLNTQDLKTQSDKTKLENESYKKKIGELDIALKNEKEERTKEGLNTQDLKTQYDKTKLENESYERKIGELESALKNEKEERTKNSSFTKHIAAEIITKDLIIVQRTELEKLEQYRDMQELLNKTANYVEAIEDKNKMKNCLITIVDGSGNFHIFESGKGENKYILKKDEKNQKCEVLPLAKSYTVETTQASNITKNVIYAAMREKELRKPKHEYEDMIALLEETVRLVIEDESNQKKLANATITIYDSGLNAHIFKSQKGENKFLVNRENNKIVCVNPAK